MATVKDMTLIDLGNLGGWYSVKLTQSGSATSDIYRLPVYPITHIGAYITGSGYLDFSLSNIDDLTSGSGAFSQWDGSASINGAVTGFRMISTSGNVTGIVTVKTTFAG